MEKPIDLIKEYYDEPLPDISCHMYTRGTEYQRHAAHGFPSAAFRKTMAMLPKVKPILIGLDPDGGFRMVWKNVVLNISKLLDDNSVTHYYTPPIGSPVADYILDRVTSPSLFKIRETLLSYLRAEGLL